jgi:hypothetical protein
VEKEQKPEERKEEKERKGGIRRKIVSVSAYFSANIPVRAMPNCLFYFQCMDMC